MADIKCARCGEGWDAYGIRNGDMDPLDAKRFNKGEGCPCCNFGGQCPSCDGTGRESSYYHHDCNTCRDKGIVLAWQPSNNSEPPFRNNEFYMGYSPNVRTLPGDLLDVKITLGVRSLPEEIDSFQSRSCTVRQWWVPCPEGCASRNTENSCTACGGNGTLTVSDPGEVELAAARSAIDASDEDPMEILIERGLL